MELAEFILDAAPIAKLFPDVARAPPRKQFEPFDFAQGRRYAASVGEFVYLPDDENDEAADFDQTRPERDEDYNQDPGW